MTLKIYVEGREPSGSQTFFQWPLSLHNPSYMNINISFILKCYLLTRRVTITYCIHKFDFILNHAPPQGTATAPNFKTIGIAYLVLMYLQYKIYLYLNLPEHVKNGI